jgi:TetR/AcrR family transcriptional regulator
VSAQSAARKRLKLGERRAQILYTLADMLAQPGAERITTAALADRLGVSEAALYRHFASKAQMLEALIGLAEASVFTAMQQITERNACGAARAADIVTLLLTFGEKNHGMTRLLVGDALVFEHERLQQRMNVFFDRVEAALCLCLRQSTRQPQAPQNPAAHAVPILASLLLAWVMGRLQRFARSGFQRLPTEHLDHNLRLLLAQA